MGLLDNLFGVRGRLPAELREDIDAEGALLLEEGLRCSVTFRGYRAPGKRTTRRTVVSRGALAVTPARLVAWSYTTENLDVPRDHPGWQRLEVQLDEPDRVCIAFDAGVFHPDRSGRVELRFTTDHAQEVVDLLR